MRPIHLNDTVAQDENEQQRYEPDHGLMPGDDGGHTNYAQLCLEEESLRNTPTGVYHLLGDCSLPKPKPNQSTYSIEQQQKIEQLQRSSIGILSTSEPTKHNITPSETKQNFVATERNAITDSRSSSSVQLNLMQLLGSTNAVVHTVETLRKVFHIRENAFKVLSHASNNMQSDDNDQQNVNDTNDNSKSDKGTGNNSSKKQNSENNGGDKQQMQAEDVVINDENNIIKNDHDNDIIEIRNDFTNHDHINSNKNYEPVRKKRRNSYNNKYLKEQKHAQQSEVRERAMGKSVCALIPAHAGFTHSSNRALDILTDVLEYFVWNIGRDLQACLNNEIDSSSSSPSQPTSKSLSLSELIRVIGSCGIRGGFPHLIAYVKTDLVQSGLFMRDVYSRLVYHARTSPATKENASLHRFIENFSSPTFKMSYQHPNIGSDGVLGDNYSKDSEKKNEYEKEGKERGKTDDLKELDLDDEAFAFGYLNRKARLDILMDGIKVPIKLAYNIKKTNSQSKKNSEKI